MKIFSTLHKISKKVILFLRTNSSCSTDESSEIVAKEIKHKWQRASSFIMRRKINAKKKLETNIFGEYFYA